MSRLQVLLDELEQEAVRVGALEYEMTNDRDRIKAIKVEIMDLCGRG